MLPQLLPLLLLLFLLLLVQLLLSLLDQPLLDLFLQDVDLLEVVDQDWRVSIVEGHAVD